MKTSVPRKCITLILTLALISALIVPGIPLALAADSSVMPYGLLTNQLENPWNVPQAETSINGYALPVGVNFSWYIAGSGLDEVQTAYQIIVTDDISGAVAWDSMKVVSSEQTYVNYAGPALLPGHPYSWTVRVWDGNDAVSAYADPVQFATGFTDSQWQADWLYTATTSTTTFFYARKEQALENNGGKVPVRALAYVCMEHEYELNVNGERIGHGMSWDWNGEQRYQGWDITDAVLKDAGNITLALVCQWKSGGQGRATSVNALIGRFVIYYSDGSSQTIVTNNTWRIATGANTPHPNHTGARNSGEGLRQDQYNATREANVAGWKEKNYTEGSIWIVPSVRGTHPVTGTGTNRFDHLIADLRHVVEEVVYPVRMHQWTEGANAGITVVDFGRVIPARVSVHFGSVNTTSNITLRSAYQLTGYSYTRSGPYADRARVPAWPTRVATANQQATAMTYIYTPKVGDQTYNEFDYIGFRYLEIPNVGYTFQEGDIWATILTSEVPADRASTIVTSDDDFNQVFEFLKSSATYSAQVEFVDTPTREQGQFLQDGINVGAALMTTTYDRELNRKAITQFLNSADRFWNPPNNVNTGTEYWQGRYNAVYPNFDGASGARDIPDYSLNMPLWIWGYYMLSGDIDTLRYAYPYMEKTVGYVQRYTTASGGNQGLVTNLGGGGNKQANAFTSVSSYCFGIVDWPANGRFGYTRVINNSWSTINMLTVQFYDLMAEAARDLGYVSDIALYEGYAQNLRNRINATFLVAAPNTTSDKPNGTAYWKYADNVTPAGARNTHFGQHSTSYALAFDIAPQEYRESMLDYCESLGMSQGPMTVNYLVEAYCENNRPQALLNLLTNRNDLGWAHSLFHQNFTFSPEEWEPYSGTNSFGNSESHGWGAACVVELYEYVAGVKNAKAGAKSIIINPLMAGVLDSVEGKVYTARGPVKTSYSGAGKDFTLTIDVPVNISATVLLPKVDGGHFVEKNGNAGQGVFTENGQEFTVGSGVREYVFQDTVYAHINADEDSVMVGTPVSYTVSVENASGVGIVELSFEFDGYILDKDSIAVTPLNGFSSGIFAGLTFQYMGAGIWQGTVKYMNAGYVQGDDLLDILIISGRAFGDKPATVTLTSIATQGDTGAGVGPMPSMIWTPEATVTFGAKPPVYSKYDLNQDSVIDGIDLLYLVYFYQWNDRDVGWDTEPIYGVYAKDCDFQVNGKIDLADMIELTANYGAYDPYDW